MLCVSIIFLMGEASFRDVPHFRKPDILSGLAALVSSTGPMIAKLPRRHSQNRDNLRILTAVIPTFGCFQATSWIGVNQVWALRAADFHLLQQHENTT
ncbi:MAG TPA: hypothetical protein VFM34_04545 [Moraxellaceae bacterium]|nr:hypothetical protein [Moraxellaceae bacterium]